MALKTRKFDMARFLETEEDIAVYLSEALETGDAATVSHALGTVAQPRDVAKVARRAGLGRESLYKALSADGNPGLATVLRVVGIDLAARIPAARPSVRKPVRSKGGKRISAARRAARATEH